MITSYSIKPHSEEYFMPGTSADIATLAWNPHSSWLLLYMWAVGGLFACAAT